MFDLKKSNILISKAVRTQNAAKLKIALDMGGNPNMVLRNGETLLIHAANSLHWLEGVEMLVMGGADINKAGGDNRTALHHAALTNDTAICRRLLELGAAPDVSDYWSGTPLHYAVKVGNVEICKLLLDAGADINTRDWNDERLIFTACHEERAEVMELLLEAGVDPNVQNTKGNTPLHSAAAHGNLRIWKLLLEHGADANVKNKFNKKPIEMAEEKNKREMFKNIMLNIDVSCGANKNIIEQSPFEWEF